MLKHRGCACTLVLSRGAGRGGGSCVRRQSIAPVGGVRCRQRDSESQRDERTTVRRKVCIITVTPAPDEPRLLRQVGVLVANGWDVTIAGYVGRQAPPENCRFVELKLNDRVLRLRDHARLVVDRTLAPISGASAESYYWRYAHFDQIYRYLADELGIRCDLAIAHDCYTAPIAARLAERSGGIFSVDCHEFAIEQYMEDADWVRSQRPWIHALEKRFLPRAAVVTTVCDGIAGAYQGAYKLAKRPVVIRSMSPYAELLPRPTRGNIGVLYHGILAPARGLEEAIASVDSWRSEFTLTIRGPGPEEYVGSLRNLVAASPAANRISIEEAVPYNEMIATAAQSDVGLFVQGGSSIQKRFTLPNKFFEYVQARLALCVGDVPEMAKLVRDHDLGVLVADASPPSIAAKINSLTHQRIDQHKLKVHSAARRLSWEMEAEVLGKAYEEAMQFVDAR